MVVRIYIQKEKEMMKKRLLALLAILLMVVVAQPAPAADLTAAADLNSAYVWRGQTLNDSLVFQPSVDVVEGNFGFNVWGNLDIDDYDDRYDSGEFSEVDITLSYLFKVQKMDFTVGYIEYLYPTTKRSGREGSREIYGSMGLPLASGLSLDMDLYYDIDELNDIYLNLGFNYTYALSQQLSLDAGMSIAYAGDEYCYDDSAGLYDYNFLVSGKFALDEDLSVSAFIKYTGSMDDDNLKEYEHGGLDVNFYCGIGVSYGF